ncbi:MAG: nucleotide exchange factor GrpE [Candidatus Woesearchaeota archaeon]
MTKKQNFDENEQKGAEDAQKTQPEPSFDGETQPQEEHTQTEESELQNQIAELTDMLKRTQAEFANYQKRMESQNQEQAKFRSQMVLQKFIPIFDNFSLAMMHTENKDECIAGVQMIKQQFWDVLESEGVERPDLVGKPFDPSVAEAIQTTHDITKEDDVVVKEVVKAYTLHGKVIRHAKVVVNKKDDTQKN